MPQLELFDPSPFEAEPPWELEPTRENCPKCGKKNPKINYHDTLHQTSPCGRYYGTWAAIWPRQPFPEHLCKICWNCGYGWAEEVWDDRDPVGADAAGGAEEAASS